MTILIAPDKFKGSLTAIQVSRAIEEGLLLINRELKVVRIPLADGGEGTCDLLTEFSGGSKVKIIVRDPLMREIKSEYGIAPDGTTAFIEMAKASGLQLLEHDERNPLYTTTFGTGQMIGDALDKGARKIILAIGGSATNDGGIGMAEALGFAFLSGNGKKIKTVGKNLIQLSRIGDGKRNQKIAQAEFTVIYDVKNPLYGEQGAAPVFAPQKGASPEEVRQLNEGLEHFAKIVEQQYHVDINFPGAGAAGGLGGGAKLFLNAKSSPGIEFILRFTNLEKAIQQADLIITGEGKIDEQTFLGKVVQGVSQLAAKYHKPCIAFTGKLDLVPARIAELGLQQIISLVDDSISESEAMQRANSILKLKAAQMLKPFIPV